MKKHHGWDVQADWLIETHSVVNAFFTAVKAFTQKGDGIMLFTPVYYPMYKAIEVNERRLVEVPLINNGISYDIDWDKFAAAAAAPHSAVAAAAPAVVFDALHAPALPKDRGNGETVQRAERGTGRRAAAVRSRAGNRRGIAAGPAGEAAAMLWRIARVSRGKRDCAVSRGERRVRRAAGDLFGV